MYFEVPGTNLRVLGSLHMFPSGSPPTPNWVTGAYEWCETVVHEHDNAKVLPCMRSDTPLHALLLPETWTALTAALPNDQVRAGFDGLRPWAALLALVGTLQSTEPGVEDIVLSQAVRDGKPLHALETGDDLRQAFDAAPLVAVEEALNRVLRDPAQMQPRLEAMYRAWTTRDRAALLEAASATMMFDNADLKEAALISRNRAWAPKVRSLLGTSQRTLVVVGAMHLCGPDNLEECLGVAFRPV